MFIGRKKELTKLEKMYQADKFQFAAIYGRRQIGKTALINEFVRNKPTIYFTGLEENEFYNLERFSSAIEHFKDPDSLSSVNYGNFENCFREIARLAQKERIVLVIDEYPYLANAVHAISSMLQSYIDHEFKQTNLFLILCGSSMSFMEEQVLSYKSPLYGRRTAQMKILPFDFEDSCKYFNGFSAEDMALIYGIVGGTPQYLLQMNDSMSVEDNIKNVFLNPASAIFEEPENLLKQEVREPAVYNAIITAVATGSSRMSEIATKIGETTSVCSQYMKNLINLGLIRKETPYGEKESRKSIYAIADNMFRFWYRFIPENNSIISRGATELAYKRIAPNLSDYMGRIFEEICMQYLWKLLLDGEAPVEFSNLGRWWGTDPQERIQTEIDIMGDQDKSTALFGECKWINENVDVKVLEKLKKRSRLFRYENVHLFLFAKKGFTPGCIEEAGKMGNVSLVTYDQIYEYLNDRGITAF